MRHLGRSAHLELARLHRAAQRLQVLASSASQRIAAAALQGLLSDPSRQGTFSDAVRISVEYADALIAELDKEGNS